MDILLPLGTIVTLDNDNKIVIIGYKGSLKNEIKDYTGCLYPHGLIDENIFCFNKSDIKKILFYGYQTPELYKMREILTNYDSKNQEKSIKEIQEYFNEEEE